MAHLLTQPNMIVKHQPATGRLDVCSWSYFESKGSNG